jgi:pimeloyl-ACP methyl ester carboxylesterase
MAASLVLCATGASGESPAQRPTFPEARIETYRDGAGRERIYRVQEPDALLKSPNILIYMHGSAGKEEQGMDPDWARGSFARLRTLMNSWGWVYVCPRDAEFKGLLKHLRGKYNPGNIYLSGASSGGHAALWEAETNPSAYAGLLLLCPAVGLSSMNNPHKLAMPVWIVSGSRDREITRQCRVLVKRLEELQRPVFYREIAGGHHGSPVEKVDWQRALEFLQEARRDVLAGPPADAEAVDVAGSDQGVPPASNDLRMSPGTHNR